MLSIVYCWTGGMLDIKLCGITQVLSVSRSAKLWELILFFNVLFIRHYYHPHYPLPSSLKWNFNQYMPVKPLGISICIIYPLASFPSQHLTPFHPAIVYLFRHHDKLQEEAVVCKKYVQGPEVRRLYSASSFVQEQRPIERRSREGLISGPYSHPFLEVHPTPIGNSCKVKGSRVKALATRCWHLSVYRPRRPPLNSPVGTDPCSVIIIVHLLEQFNPDFGRQQRREHRDH